MHILAIVWHPNTRWDALEDADNDRYPNIFEVRLGSDPQDAQAIPVATYVVDPVGGGTHRTLQTAIDAVANVCEIVLVKPGVYLENLYISGKPLFLLLAEAGTLETVVDSQGSGRVLDIRSTVVVEGFTLTGLLASSTLLVKCARTGKPL